MPCSINVSILTTPGAVLVFRALRRCSALRLPFYAHVRSKLPRCLSYSFASTKKSFDPARGMLGMFFLRSL